MQELLKMGLLNIFILNLRDQMYQMQQSSQIRAPQTIYIVLQSQQENESI